MATPFADRLEILIRRREMSISELGRLTDPTNPERGRRRVQRHLAGTEPSEASRSLYARVLDSDELLTVGLPEPPNLPSLLRAAARELEKGDGEE